VRTTRNGSGRCDACCSTDIPSGVKADDPQMGQEQSATERIAMVSDGRRAEVAGMAGLGQNAGVQS
jgi:hypothetical protein